MYEELTPFGQVAMTLFISVVAVGFITSPYEFYLTQVSVRAVTTLLNEVRKVSPQTYDYLCAGRKYPVNGGNLGLALPSGVLRSRFLEFIDSHELDNTSAVRQQKAQVRSLHHRMKSLQRVVGYYTGITIVVLLCLGVVGVVLLGAKITRAGPF